MGAQIVEKHITLDRRMKGTDQAGSLSIEGINRMVRDIRILELSLGKEEIFIDDEVNSSKVKLERSIATNRKMQIGEIITENDIHMLSPGDGFKWIMKDEVIGKKLKMAVDKDEIIYPFMIS
jgi:sialic acid synthase